jgi:hypothetical protein
MQWKIEGPMFPLMEKPPYASLEGLDGLEDVPHREGFL